MVQLPSGYIPRSIAKFICDNRTKCLTISGSEISGKSSSETLCIDSGTAELGGCKVAKLDMLGERGGREYPRLPFLEISFRRGSSHTACLNFVNHGSSLY